MINNLIRRLLSQKGQALIETVLIITLISIIGLGALTVTGINTDSIFSSVAQCLSGDDAEEEEKPLGPIPDADNTTFYLANGDITDNPREASYCIAHYGTYASRKTWGGTAVVEGVGTDYYTDINGWENTEAVLKNTSLAETPGTIWEYCSEMREATGGYWYVPAAKELTNFYSQNTSFRPASMVWTSTQSSSGTSAYPMFSGSASSAYSKTDKNDIVLFRDTIGVKQGKVDSNVLSSLAWTQENAQTENAKYVSFLGKDWIVIGCNGSGIYSAEGTMTLLLANIENSTQFLSSNSTCNYISSLPHQAVAAMWDSIKSSNTNLSTLVQPRSLNRGNYSANAPWSDGIMDNNAPLSSQYLWLLSTSEAMTLTEDNATYSGAVTQSDVDWWLRSPGRSSNNAAYVKSSGSVVNDGTYPSLYTYGIRPALRAQLNSLVISSGDGSKENPYVLTAK